MVTAEEMAQYANEQYEVGVYKAYMAARELKEATYRYRLPDIRSRAAGPRLLDVGCSCGFFIGTALQAGFDAHGIEFSETAVAAADDYIRPRITIGNVDEWMPEEEQKFDVVTAFDIIEHSHDPLALLRKLRTVLRDEGLIVLAAPDTDHYLRYIMHRSWSMLQAYQHTVMMSKRAMRYALKKTGFRDAEVRPTRKVLTADYLASQISIHNPMITKIYGAMSPAIPVKLRNQPIAINISEYLAFARVRSW